jgi:hypothetical protein
MYSNNSWFQTNVKLHSIGEQDFRVDITPHKFVSLDISSAAKTTAELLYGKYKNIYLAYSGGLDSEFILKTFVENNIPITPVIVLTPHNHLETCYAIHYCRKHNLSPVILEYTEKQLLEAIHRLLLTKVKNFSPTCACFIHMLLVMEYAEANGGVMLCGEHPISDEGKNDINSTMGNDITFQSGPFYYNAISVDHPPAFFYYTLELFYSVLKNIDYTMQVNEAKAKLFGLEYRPKLEQQNDTIYRNAIDKLAKQMGFTDSKQDIFALGDSQSFCKLMENKYIAGEQNV